MLRFERASRPTAPSFCLSALLGPAMPINILSERTLGRTTEIVWMSPTLLPDDEQSRSAVALARTASLPQLGGIEEHIPYPTKVKIRSSVHGEMTIHELSADTTLGALKQTLVDRLKLAPERVIHLSHWGADLDGDTHTLQELKLKEGCTLEMRSSLGVRPLAMGLERVRVVCTALETRTVAVERGATVLDLKERIARLLLCGEHEWYDKNGTRTAVTGGTLLSITKAAADDKTGFGEQTLGEEFITTAPMQGEMGKGKPISVIRARQGGAPVLLNDVNLVQVHLPSDKQRLTFRGMDAPDTAMLWALGVRQDDCISLEFESPCEPPVLKLLRAPVMPKAKGGKKGKGGGKKKK